MQIKFYRPTKLNEFIGQENIKFNLNIYINSCKKNKLSLDHILITGPSGSGKTTLSNIIADSLNSKITFIQGSHIKKISDILNLFSLIVENEIIFIDEIHMIDKSIIELLYTVMEDFVIDIPLGTENNQKISRLKLPKFTLIAATNFLSKLPNPLIDRFAIKLHLDHYSNSDIYDILNQICSKHKLNIDVEHIRYISEISKNNPRIAINLLKRYLDYLDFYKNDEINIVEVFKKIGIFKNGLSNVDIQYLKILNDHKFLSITNISQYLGIDKQTIESNIENYLIKINFISISSKGREITPIAKEYLFNLT